MWRDGSPGGDPPSNSSRGGKQNLNVAGRVPLSTYLDREGERIDGQCELRPDEGVIVEVG
jgi:hypothetical protein